MYFGINSNISKFADSTEIGQFIKSDIDIAILQKVLANFLRWANKWIMTLDTEKCCEFSAYWNSPQNNYTLKNKFSVTLNICPYGLIYLQPRNHCIIAKNCVNRILGFIHRDVTNRIEEDIIKSQLALVRPHLEYSVLFWYQYYRKDIDTPESVKSSRG